MESTPKNLKARWEELKQTQPHLRIRNAADSLKVSEAELLATRCGSDEVTRLLPAFKEILQEVESLGKVMALTRNNDVVHERKGVYANASLENPHVGLFVGEDIDLRIFFKSWDSAFAVTDTVRGKARYSLQFFAKDGEAIHKIYLTAKSNLDKYQALVTKYRHEDQSDLQAVHAWDETVEEHPDENIDVAAFQKGWINLEDTHDFFGLVRKHKLTRTQALRLAPAGNYAIKVNPQAFRKVVTLAAERNTPIMVFVGNKGMIQIHTGPVKKLLDHQDWFNIMDPDFNLHVKEPHLKDVWVVRKPTKDGVVTALECFDAQGNQIVQLFGKRKPGIPELTAWQEIIAEVEKETALQESVNA
ncbi:hemin-degrading factor [Microscilla marina]|uniref:Hemin degrading factor n=1 Tax=Microscilla marina ATCC 23134 TaxID=313606 RepID=A1ZKA1_MICM2|nr:hemin-degrading factor [Microscilla marina]EAY29127.1 hemin degrading factor [Microscilla marina ATCC 23134]